MATVVVVPAATLVDADVVPVDEPTRVVIDPKPLPDAFTVTAPVQVMLELVVRVFKTGVLELLLVRLVDVVVVVVVLTGGGGTGAGVGTLVGLVAEMSGADVTTGRVCVAVTVTSVVAVTVGAAIVAVITGAGGAAMLVTQANVTALSPATISTAHPMTAAGCRAYQANV